MHERLREALQSLGIDSSRPPGEGEWRRLLERLETLITEVDGDRRELEAWTSLRATLPALYCRTTVDGTILALNRTVDGTPVEKYVGVNVLDLFAPESLPVAEARIAESVATRRATSFRAQAPKPPTGEMAWWQTDLCPLLRGGEVVGLAFLTRDITDFKRDEDALRHSEQENRALVQAIPDLIFRQARDGRYLSFKAPDGFNLPFDESEIVGRTPMEVHEAYPDVLPRDLAERGQRLVHRVLATGRSQTVEFTLSHESGGRSVEIRLAPLDQDEVLGLVRDVTERARAVEALRRSEEKNRALVDALPDLMFLLSSDGRYLEWKPAKDFDPFVPPEQFLGRHVDEVLPAAVAAQWRMLLRDVRPGEVIAWEYELGGREYEARLTACGEGALATVRDVTERRRSDAELRQSEALYANLFRHSTDGIVLHDRDGHIIDLNQRAESLFGYSKGELVGRALHDLHPPDPTPEPRYAARRMSRDGVVEFETRYLKKDGEVFIAEVSASTFELGGQRVVQSILRDVTERRRFEESLRAAKDEAERASRAKSQFLSNMSHELRTPLNAILGFGRVLDRGAYGPLNERQRQYLHDIIHSGEHMLELVNNLLDLRRLEEHRDFIRPVPTTVGPLVAEAVAMVKPLVDERSHRFAVDVEDDLPEALADGRALVRVLVNLLSNAVKFTEPGGRIRLCVLAHDGLLVFEVHDSGVGIPTEHQTRIFNYFEQVRGSERLVASGTGIGLALSRELVECMNGAIGVRSEPGRGSVFYFTLPTLGPDSPRPDLPTEGAARGGR